LKERGQEGNRGQIPIAKISYIKKDEGREKRFPRIRARLSLLRAEKAVYGGKAETLESKLGASPACSTGGEGGGAGPISKSCKGVAEFRVWRKKKLPSKQREGGREGGVLLLGRERWTETPHTASIGREVKNMLAQGEEKLGVKQKEKESGSGSQE